MDLREFELSNERCKPKHFAPPTALQRRLRRDAAHRLADAGNRAKPWPRRWLKWLARVARWR